MDFENMDIVETSVSDLVMSPFLLEDENGNPAKIAYDRLEELLRSNEAKKNKMALSAMCLLSARDSDPLTIADKPQFLPLILSHAGVYDNCETRRLIFESYKLSMDNIIYGFWSQCVDNPRVRCLLCEKYISSYDSKGKINHGPLSGRKAKILKNQKNTCCTFCPCDQKGPEAYFAKGGIFENPEWKINKPSSAEMEILNDRIELVTDIIRNLIVDSNTGALMANDSTFLRYLIILLHCSSIYLKGIGLEILSNISPYLNLTKPEKRPLAQFIIAFVSNGIKSPNVLVSIHCVIAYGAWFRCKPGKTPQSDKSASKNFLAVKSYVNLQDISTLLQKYTVEKETIICSLLLETIWNISIHKIGCDDLCNEEDLIATLVGIGTQDVHYNNPWSLEKDNIGFDESSMTDSVTSSQTSIPPLKTSFYQQFRLTVNQTLSKKDGYYFRTYGDEYEKELGMSFEQCDDNIRLCALRILRNIVRLSAKGKRLLQPFESRFDFQPTTRSDMDKLIQEIVESIDSLVDEETSVIQSLTIPSISITY